MKKALSLLLLLCLGFSLFSGTALAEETEFILRTPEDLERLAALCVLDTASRGLTVVLAGDLDLGEKEFSPIPLFSGHFDGKGHSIRGLRITDAASVTGLFRQILPGGVVEGLRVFGTVTPGGKADRVGGLCGRNQGILRDCAFSGKVAGSRSVGGVCGVNDLGGLAEGCSAEGSVAGEHQVGGVAGENRGVLRDCRSRCEVNTEEIAVSAPAETGLDLTLTLTLTPEEILDVTDVGGIVGVSTGTLENCENGGSVGRLHVGYNIGGVAGRLSGDARDCRNLGQVSGRKDVGGVAGQLDPETRWSFQESRLSEVKELLTALKLGADRLAADAGTESEAVRQGVGDILTALDRTEAAAEALTGEAVNWLDDNLETVNALGARLEMLTKGLEDVGASLEDFSEVLPGAARSLEEAFQALEEAGSLAGDGMEAASASMGDVSEGLTGLRLAGDQLRRGFALLRSGLGDPAELQAALEDISMGIAGLARSWGRTETALRSLEAWLQGLALPTREELLETAGEALDSTREALETAGEAAGEALDNLKERVQDGTLYQIGEDVEPWLLERQAALREDWKALKAALLAWLGSLRDDTARQVGAAADLEQDLRWIGEGSSRLLAAPDAEELQGFFTGVEAASALFSASTQHWIAAGGELRDSLQSFSGAGDEIARTSGKLAEAVGKLGEALEALHGATSGIHDLAAQLSDEPSLALTPLRRESEVREELFSSLREAGEALHSLGDRGDPGALKADVQAISESMTALVELLLRSFREDAAQGIVLEDVSQAAATLSAGVVSGSSNAASVRGETNVGGVVGAVTIDLSLDLEEDPALSSFLSGGARYLVSAALLDCSSEGEVTALRSAAGGIAGRMDYGAAVDCTSAGDVSSAGDYAGGIVGYSAGTVRRCMARAFLSGGNYVGGIAGLGHALEDCLSLPSFAGSCEFQGAVAGDADGPVSGNLYCDSPVGGVNGFSFAEEALPVSYEALREKSGGAPVFETVTVTFLRDGEPAAVVEVPYGGSLEDLPPVEEQEGMRWRWDPFPRDGVKRSLTVDGYYVNPITTLSSGEPLPLFLAEGSFVEGQRLQVRNETLADGGKAHTLTVEGYEGPITLRMREEREGAVLRLRPEGGEEVLEAHRDGSYLVFSLENGGTVTFRAAESPGWTKLAVIGGIALLFLLLLLLLLRRRKKRRAAVAAPQE